MAKAQQTPVADADDTAFDDEFDADPNTSFDDEDEDDLGQPKDGVDSADEDDDADVEMRIEDVLKKPVGQIFSAIALQGVSSHAKKRPVSALDDAWLRTTHTRIKGLMTANPDAPEGDRWDRDLQLLESESDVRKLDLDAEPKPAKATKTVTAPVGTIAVVALATAAISPDPAQARDEGADDELAASIASVGVLQPIRVYEDAVHPGFYIIEDGERRYRGTVKAGIKTVPAIIVPAPESVGDKLLIQVASNDGKRLTPMEEARTFKRIMADKGWSIQQLAAALGRSKSTVSDRVALADAPVQFQPLFEDGSLTAAAAPIVRKYAELPPKVLSILVERAQDDYQWSHHLQDGKTIPLKSVEQGLRRAIDYMFAEVDKAVEWAGDTFAVDGKTYTSDRRGYEATSQKHFAKFPKAAASSSPSAPAKPDKWQLQQRAAERAHRRKVHLRTLQFQALSAKLPTSIEGRWALFALEYLIKDIGSDTRRMAFKGLALPMGKKSLSGIDFAKELTAHAQDLDGAGRIRMLLQLLIAADLNVNQWGSDNGRRLNAAAALAKCDLKKVKLPDEPKKGATKKARR